MTQLTENVFAVEVPEDATDIVVHNEPPKIIFTSKIQDPAQCGGDMIRLPPGSWQFICTTKEATEQQAKGIVGWLQIGDQLGYQDYRFDDPRFPYKLATQSLNSLCKAKGLDVSKNYALLKKG